MSIALPFPAHAQKLRYDTSYISSHATDLTVRVFGGQKFSGYKLDKRGMQTPLTYKPNNNMAIGFGMNYRFVGFNLAVKAPFINDDNEMRGKTKLFDLRTFIYLRRFTIDMYGQLCQGYYIRNNDVFATPPPAGTYLQREDIRTRIIGVNAQYIFNHYRFSYKAAYLQNEIQKKSVGSWLAGAGVHYNTIYADSAIIPRKIADAHFSGNRFNESKVFCVSLNAGYGYTLVAGRYFFATAALIGDAGINVTSQMEDLQPAVKQNGLHLGGTLRLAAGYNTTRNFAGVQYIDFLSRNAMPMTGGWQEWEMGSFKVTVTRRFVIKRNVLQDTYDALYP